MSSCLILVEDKISNVIEIYQSQNNKTAIEVRLNEDTVWLSLKQMSELFQRDKSVISRHIGNVFKENELTRDSTVAKFATVQTEGERSVERDVEYFNLDVIISVGYRVKSIQGTQFRIWANKVIKEYLVKGYALNQRLLENQKDKLKNLKSAIHLVSKLSTASELDSNTKDIIIGILDKYSNALLILDDYDYKRISNVHTEYEKSYILDYNEVAGIIDKMKSKSANSDLFGKQKDESLKSSIAAIYQTYDGIDLYPSVLDKAVNLLYFLVKNHSFVDGNKRIAAALFLYFLQKNDKLSKINLDNNLLASLTLLIANSKPNERELIINITKVMLVGNDL
jgi:prophage maintenance system killer protein